MRKVTQQIKEAFEARKSKTVGNTHTDGERVFLHGNKIVERREDGIYASLAGWGTPTTRERVNGITGAGFYQQNYEQLLNGQEIDFSSWYKVGDHARQV